MNDPFDSRLPVEPPDQRLARRQRNSIYPVEVQQHIETLGLFARSMLSHELNCDQCGNPYNDYCPEMLEMRRARDKWKQRLRQLVKQHNITLTV